MTKPGQTPCTHEITHDDNALGLTDAMAVCSDARASSENAIVQDLDAVRAYQRFDGGIAGVVDAVTRTRGDTNCYKWTES